MVFIYTSDLHYMYSSTIVLFGGKEVGVAPETKYTFAPAFTRFSNLTGLTDGDGHK